MIERFIHNLSWQILLLGFIYLCTLPLLQPWVNSDGVAYYSQLRSFVMDGDLQFANEFHHFHEEFTTGSHPKVKQLEGISEYIPEHSGQGLYKPEEDITKTGHVGNHFAFGPAVLWLPFFIVGHWVTLLGIYLGAPYKVDGYSYWYVFFSTFGTTVYGFIGLCLSYRITREYVSSKAAFVSTATFWFASSLLYYMYLTPTMGHTHSFFAVALFLFTWLMVGKKNRRVSWFLLGITAGLMVLVRWQDVLFLLIPTLELYHEKIEWRKTLPQVILFLPGFVLAFFPQMLCWKIIYGNWLLIPQGSDFLIWWRPMVHKVLFSSRHGLFTWTPVTLIALIGLGIGYGRNKQMVFSLLLVFVLQVFINSIVMDWWCGASFGYRRLINCLPIFILGLGYFYDLLSKRLGYFIVYTVAFVFMLWNIGLLVQYALGMISHTEAVSFYEIAINQFTRVPERVGTVVRFILFRR